MTGPDFEEVVDVAIGPKMSYFENVMSELALHEYTTLCSVLANKGMSTVMDREGTGMLTESDSKPAVDSPKRIAIIEAANRLFLDSGYDMVSMDAIADAAQVSKRTVYSHFSNKETLFGGVMQEMCRRFNRMDPFDVPPGPPEEVLRTLGLDFVNLITSPEALALFRIVTAEAPRHPELAEVFYRTGPDTFCEAIGRYLETQTKQGVLQVDIPGTAAMQFWELVKAPYHLKLVLGLAERPSASEIERSVDYTVTHFLKMYQVR